MLESDSCNVVAPDAQKASGNVQLYDQILYIDTPIANTVSQIRAFYEDGVFQAEQTPVFLKPRLSLALQTMGLSASLRPARILPMRSSNTLPVRDGGIVFYPFNSQSNMNRVSDRSATHVLILHGESNKAASFRPAARLYDYVTIAGPLARHRYVKAAIFSPAEMDEGRAVMMGDTFVQTLRWAQRAEPEPGSAILYCPTWEGYGGAANNYSSIVGGYGFDHALQAAKMLGARSVIVKPHPYLGTLKPKMIVEFLRGLRKLRTSGFDVKLALSGVNLGLRAAVRIGLRNCDVIDEASPQPVSMALVDTSGMEAVFLKQKLPHMVLMHESPPFGPLKDIYSQKAILPGDTGTKRLVSYLDQHLTIDNAHRDLVFGWHTPALATMKNADRINWLNRHIKANTYWKHCSETL